jgi:hypothetical protein
MERTIPADCEKISDWEAKYTDNYRALRHECQLAFDDPLKHIDRHSMVGRGRNHHTPELAHPVSICVRQQHEVRELREENFLRRALDTGYGVVENLTPALGARHRLLDTGGEVMRPLVSQYLRRTEIAVVLMFGYRHQPSVRKPVNPV